jgi:hypothetical protein
MTVQGERAEAREELDLLLEVDQLEVVSECPESVLLLLLASVLNVRTIKTGIHCQIADSTVSSILAANALQHLKVARSLQYKSVISVTKRWKILTTSKNIEEEI